MDLIGITWEGSKTLFFDKYFSLIEREKKQNEFKDMEQVIVNPLFKELGSIVTLNKF